MPQTVGPTVGVERQISLPWRQAFSISMRNVTLRLGRAVVAGAGIVLGIAFLMSVWTSQVIEEGVERHAQTSRKYVGADSDLGKEEAERERVSKQAKNYWLIVMSLLVCGVGITNSLLMSVTERFREIGTMKCLGALDNFIVRLFLIEAVVLGVLGSALGAVIGHVVMLIAGCIKHHDWSVPAKMNWLVMLMYLGISLLVGIVLSLVAALLPAWSAARMPPAAALRTEV
ncbi:MAG: ABC transporter permease [Candidatus Zipacnadales bacterium]